MLPPRSHPFDDSSRDRDPVQFSPPWVDDRVPIEGAGEVGVLVLAGYGLNCEAESAAGFALTGARPRVRHFADVVEAGAAGLDGIHIVVFPGGFSFGDHIGSGRVFANRVRDRWGDVLRTFVDDGGLVLGICNGFQTIMKLGLVPAIGRSAGASLGQPQGSLMHNDRPGYYDAWVKLRCDPQSPCVFTRGTTGTILEFPSRHGEGKVVFAPGIATEVLAGHRVPLFYVDAEGSPTESWPANPNGSPHGVAGLCDVTGRVFGLMPHPEAYLYPENHPDWIAQADEGRRPLVGHGLGLLANGVRAVLNPSRL